jgi:putative ABC transport system ATP-binding protein
VTGPAKIELELVTRRYRIGEVTVTALEDVSLTVAGGEFTVILGPSGSGKTTLLNVIGALDSPTSGRLVVGGRLGR